MRVTNERAQSAIKAHHITGNLTNIVKDYAADLLEARGLIKEMRETLQSAIKHHVNTLENGRDVIISLGGTCDSVEDMERGDRLVIEARAILDRTKEYT